MKYEYTIAVSFDAMDSDHACGKVDDVVTAIESAGAIVEDTFSSPDNPELCRCDQCFEECDEGTLTCCEICYSDVCDNCLGVGNICHCCEEENHFDEFEDFGDLDFDPT